MTTSIRTHEGRVALVTGAAQGIGQAIVVNAVSIELASKQDRCQQHIGIYNYGGLFMATMCSAQIKQANSQFEIINKDIPKPDAQQVRVKVHACGVCHSDLLTQMDNGRASTIRRSPGHEIRA